MSSSPRKPMISSGVEAILDGRQPRDLTADKLLAHSRLPLGWRKQRVVLGFA